MQNSYKNIYMKIIKLFFLAWFFTSNMNAQTDFRPGYVIKTNGDSLVGIIDYKDDAQMGKICKFKIKDSDNETIFTPIDLTEYRFNDSKYFVSREIMGKKVFLEFLIKGNISIYYLRDDKGDRYFIEKNSSGIIEIPYNEGIKYKENIPYFYNSTKHIGVFNYFMQDAPELQSRIATMGKPEHKNLIKLAEDYHNMVCKDSACIVYEKKLPLLYCNIEIVGGFVSYHNTFNNEKNYFQVGVLSHFWMPRTSEKMYFRTGFLHSTLESNDVKEPVYKIPLQIEYIYPKGIVKPVLAFGINIYRPFYQSVAFMGGLKIKLNKSLFLGLNYDIDFNPNDDFPLLPKSILSQSLSTGIIFKI